MGKSHFQKGLSDYLTSRGVGVRLTREPGGTPSADRIREVFNHPPPEDPLTIETEALLISAARSQHTRTLVRPQLEKGTWVVSDRFADSTRVYQGSLGKVPSQWLEQLISSSTGSLEPDLTFLLDCPVEVSLERLKARGGEVTRYDQAKVEVHNTLRQAYADLAKKFPQRIVVINADETPEKVLAQGLSVLRERFDV